MFRRPVVARRRGSPLLGTAILGGAAYAAGKSSQRGATREQTQEQRLSQLEQQQAMGMPQQGKQNMPSTSQVAPQPGMSMPQQGYQNVPPVSQTAPQQMRQQPSPQPQAYQQSTSMPQEDVSASQAASATEASPDKLTQLKTLGELRVSGVLTDAEFEMEKQKILRS